jgi:hypothetical protein
MVELSPIWQMKSVKQRRRIAPYLANMLPVNRIIRRQVNGRPGVYADAQEVFEG